MTHNSPRTSQPYVDHLFQHGPVAVVTGSVPTLLEGHPLRNGKTQRKRWNPQFPATARGELLNSLFFPLKSDLLVIAHGDGRHFVPRASSREILITREEHPRRRDDNGGLDSSTTRGN